MTVSVDMLKTGQLRPLSPPTSPVAKLRARVLAGLNPLALSSEAPTITQLGPNASNNRQASGIASAAQAYASGVIAGTEGRFSMLFPSLYSVVGTSNDGTPFYRTAASGQTDSAAVGTVAFYTDAPVVEICNRRDERWQVMVDGALAAASTISTNTGTSFGLTRTVMTFASRKRRKFIAYGQNSGFWGVAVGPTDTLEPIDMASEVSILAMSDSYGSFSSDAFTGGPFWYAAMRLGAYAFTNSPGGGSGYDTLGTGSLPNFLTRLPLRTDATVQPDILLTAGGINDGASVTNAAAYFQLARQTLPNSLLIATGPWTPSNSARTAAPAKRTVIDAAIAAVTGPTIFIDNVLGTWRAKSIGGTITTGTAGYAPWQTGNGTTGATTGSGNGDFYCVDGVHPSEPAGNVFVGLCLATAIRDAVLSMSA